MSRVPAVTYETADAETRALWDQIVKEHGHVTNMKAVLIHSPIALHAVLEWYRLFDRIKPVIGERLAVLFCHAISVQNACELCTTFMRREIKLWGEDPDHLSLSEDEQAVVDFGRQLAADANRIPDALFVKLQKRFNSAEIVDLTAFGALMIVNNVFNDALRIDIDESLADYRIDPERLFAR
jgi:alkylhydroperoxidase family enzyme